MNLEVTIGQAHPLHLQNPVIAASGTYGSGLEYKPYGDIGSLGGICVKGISAAPSPGNPTPRIVETASGMLNSIGLQNDGVEAFLQKLPDLPWRKTAIIANIFASSVEGFGVVAARLADIPEIAALEVNISCPNLTRGKVPFASSPLTCASVVRTVRQNAPHNHIMVKLSPNVTDICEIARAAEGEGADSLSCINTLMGMAIDSRSRRPLLGNIIGGLSGPAIKPVALRCVWQTAQSVRIPVIGVGGICSADDIIEFLLAGASAVQVGTANFMRPDMCFRLVEALPQALAERNVSSPTELCGALVI